jgi:hypothetical protein
MSAKPKGTPERTYPALEEFVERASKDDPKRLFAPTRKRLAELAKGPKAPAAKKVMAALDRTEGLLAELVDLRESLAAGARSAKKPSR